MLGPLETGLAGAAGNKETTDNTAGFGLGSLGSLLKLGVFIYGCVYLLPIYLSIICN